MNNKLTLNWQELAFNSHYQTAVAIAEQLAEGHVKDAQAGLQELIEAMGRSERLAVRSQLVRLMVHIIKWKCQPSRRTRSWAVSIEQAREEIDASREEVPSITRETIEQMWDKCFSTALRQAQRQMGKKARITSLSWSDVFEADYFLAEESDEDT